MANKKDFDNIRDEIEARAATLRLADNKGWGTALQIVGSNDKMMEKYKDHIPLFSHSGAASRYFNRNKSSKAYRHKRKRYSSPSSDSERDEKEPLGFQNVKESLTASTVEALVTSPPAALPQVLEPPPSQRMETNHTRTPFLEDCLVSGLREPESRMSSISGCMDVLTAVSRTHLETQLTDPSKEYRVKRVYRTLLKDHRKAKDPNWPRDPLTVAALKFFVDKKPQLISDYFWIRDAALIAIGLRTMRRPGELCSLKLKDIKFGEKLFWVHISSSKTDQFANRKFIPIEYSNSKYCPVRLLRRYLAIRPRTSDDRPLFLSRSKVQLSVGVVGAIVKRIAENAGLQGRFTAHSIRIGGATAAMEAGMSLAQIQAIAGWDSKSVMLYLRTVGMANLMFSKKMGF
ncbi:5906_t:CDS:2 [Cetraspora pellucida]|uniref:5906_t:CDS:1 n=1 Tax=Cetraspora pellucida TaxID=1433469 RepID=A0A9N9D546_9GLOM|nr:5906_t:CDS:2 [Cetraspora pellucida]